MDDIMFKYESSSEAGARADATLSALGGPDILRWVGLQRTRRRQ